MGNCLEEILRTGYISNGDDCPGLESVGDDASVVLLLRQFIFRGIAERGDWNSKRIVVTLGCSCMTDVNNWVGAAMVKNRIFYPQRKVLFKK